MPERGLPPSASRPLDARVTKEGDDVPGDALLDVDTSRRHDRVDELGSPGHWTEGVERGLGRLLGQHARLVAERRIADRHPHGEAVELGLRQRIRALVLDRVLGRDDEERPVEDVRRSVDGDLRLLHRLEERGLRLRRGAVDLVDEEDVGEDRPGPEAEGAALAIEDVDPRDVGREQVGCELHPVKRQVEGARDRLREDGLADAGHVFDEHVALREEAEERKAQRLRRGVDRRAEVRDDAFGEGGRVRAAVHGRGRALAHERPSRSSSTSSRMAPAITGFAAFATWRSPVREMSRTSLSTLSKPMSARPTSL